MTKQVDLNDINTTNFNKLLNTWEKSSTTQRDRLQAFIVFGLIHYSNTGDTTYLTQIYHAASRVKAYSDKKIKAYIMVHANVYLAKDKSTGAPVFKKKKKEGEKVANEITLPEYSWYESADSAGKEKEKKGFDFAKYVKNVSNKMNKEGIDIDRLIRELQALKAKSNGPVKHIKAA